MIVLAEGIPDLNSLKSILDARKDVDDTLLEEGLLTAYLPDGSTYRVSVVGSSFIVRGFSETGDNIGSFKSNSIGQIVNFIIKE